jgi:hypothetical protein
MANRRFAHGEPTFANACNLRVRYGWQAGLSRRSAQREGGLASRRGACPPTLEGRRSSPIAVLHFIYS